MKRFAALMLACLFIFSLSACSAKKTSYVLTIDGQRISKGEYMVYLYEQKKSFEERGGVDIWEADFDGTSAEDVAKQNAINSLTLVKAAVARADSLHVSLDDNDTAEIASEAAALYNDIGNATATLMDVNEDDIKKIIKESHIQQKVYDLVTEGFQVNEADFEQYFNEHYNSEIDMYNNLTIKQIYFPLDSEASTANYDKATEARAKINNGESFEKVQEEYTESEKKDAFLLEDEMYDDNINTTLYHLPKGGVSDVLEGTDGYYIFKIVSVETADISSVKEGLKNEYIRDKKMEIYQAQNDQWQANMDIQKNNDVYDLIGIDDC